MKWEIVESGRLPAEAVMAKDGELLSQLSVLQAPILHFYEWESSCLTYGYFTDPSRYLDLEALHTFGISWARRPTGGGIIFHLTDYAFSVLLPSDFPALSVNTLENYALINQHVAKAISELMHQRMFPTLLTVEPQCSKEVCLGFCMAKPTHYDLVVEGKKVGGAAQRRTKHGLLHQGSISLALPPFEVVEKVVKGGKAVVKVMQQHSEYLFPELTGEPEMRRVREVLKEELKKSFKSL